jgi:hypothetical protein
VQLVGQTAFLRERLINRYLTDRAHLTGRIPRRG